MNGIRYVSFAPVLALAALVLSISPVTMPVIAMLFDIHTKGYTHLEVILGLLFILGWLPALAIALIADRISHRVNSNSLMINLTHTISTLAILVSLSWITLLIIAPLISYFIPGH